MNNAKETLKPTVATLDERVAVLESLVEDLTGRLRQVEKNHSVKKPEKQKPVEPNPPVSSLLNNFKASQQAARQAGTASIVEAVAAITGQQKKQ